ncbi:MAG TPA: hypothetical protein VMJ32_12835 [Pirellulales bacterium]|nr:hypothetical protein [Pirellulales bacterium]
MSDDLEDDVITNIIVNTPEDDAAYAGPGKWLLVSGVVVAVAVALFAILKAR